MAGPSAVARRQFGTNHGVSQTHRDVTDDRYRDLRKPRRVRFFCNGDRYFKGKKMFITPHRYLTFNDLLNDLTGKLPSSVHLPYGVRTIYSPVGGSKIRDIESLQDGENYVVAGFETFKGIRYGKNAIEPWSHGECSSLFCFLLGHHEQSLFPVHGMSKTKLNYELIQELSGPRYTWINMFSTHFKGFTLKNLYSPVQL